MSLNGLIEDVEHILGLCDHDDGACHHRPGVIIDEVDDLDVPVALELPVRHIGLPTLIGQIRLKTDEGVTWSLLRLGCDKTTTGEYPVNCRQRRWTHPLSRQVIRDSTSACIKA